MRRATAIALALALSGCNAGAGRGPDVRAQVTPDFSASMQRYGADLDLAHQHRMTYVAAARRLKQGALSTPGAALSDADSLLISYILAMSAEVNAGRMTHEMLLYKMQERVQQNNAAQQQSQQASRLQALPTLQALHELQQRAAPPSLPDPPTYQAPPVYTPPVRLQTNCTTTNLGGFVTTNCQ